VQKFKSYAALDEKEFKNYDTLEMISLARIFNNRVVGALVSDSHGYYENLCLPFSDNITPAENRKREQLLEKTGNLHKRTRAEIELAELHVTVLNRINDSNNPLPGIVLRAAFKEALRTKGQAVDDSQQIKKIQEILRQNGATSLSNVTLLESSV
jgi:hypothetical protein